MNGMTRRDSLRLLAAGTALPLLSTPLVAQSRQKVSIGIQNGLTYLGYLLADGLGLYAKHAEAQGAAVDFELTRISGPTAMTEGLLSDTIQIAALGMQPLLIGYYKTRGSYDMGGLCASWLGTYTFYTNVPEVQSLANIKPEYKIAVPSPTSSQAVILRRAALKLFGDASRFDNQMVSLPHPDAVTALATGNTVQLYLAISPFTEVLANDPKVHAIATSKEFNPPGMTNGVIAALGGFVNANPAAVRAFIGAMDEANKFIPQNVEKSAEVYFAAEPSKLSDDEKLAVLRNNKDEYTIVPTGTVETAEFMKSQGQLETAPASWTEVYFPPITEGKGS